MKKSCKSCCCYKEQEYHPAKFNDCYRGCPQMIIEKSKEGYCNLWQQVKKLKTKMGEL